MTLEFFLEILIKKLEKKNIAYCILRNYDTLPEVLKQGDIDFLVLEQHIVQIDVIIKSIYGIHIVGVTKRQYVRNYFIYNIEKNGDSKALQIDFIFNYIYKGTKYLELSYFINNKIIMKNKFFNIPSRFDEAFLNFFPFYLSTGTLNNKYEDIIISVFKENTEQFKIILKKLGFNISLINELYDAVVNNNYKQLKDLSRLIKAKVFIRNFNLFDILSHFLVETILRIPFKNSRVVKVNLQPKNKKILHKSLNSFAKNIIYIDTNNLFDFLKFGKIQTNFTLYIMYNNDSNTNVIDTLNEITSSFE